jgi:hypothetical protein
MYRFEAHTKRWQSISLIVWVFVASLALTVIVPETAHGGWFGKKKEKSEPRRPQRFDTAPDMMYLSGTLARSGYDGWRVDDTNVQILPTTDVNSQDAFEATTRSLREGKEVLLMGSMLGSLFVVREAIIVEPDYYYVGVDDGNDAIVWSPSDPTVGIGVGVIPQ